MGNAGTRLIAQSIAIIGAGTAGLAAAAFLQQSGHNVTLFERFDAPKPLGAGLLIQPAGLAVLSLLGLDKQIIASGSVIRRLYGRDSGSKAITLDVAYRDFVPHLFGVGVHRGNLFSALYNKVMEAGVAIKSSTTIINVEQTDGKADLIAVDGRRFDGYDLVIDASGQKSGLREKSACVKSVKPYPYGAVWSTVTLHDNKFRLDTLEQRYKNAYHMIGVLPTGKANENAPTKAAFFWSLRVADYPQWKERNFSQWQDYVADLWPETADLVRQFSSYDDLKLATYSDVVLRVPHSGNIIFIGDAAHCTSPQLGQGANLALMDAFILSQCIDEAFSVEEAFHIYTKRRRKHLLFYQMASRILTPFFQSDSWLFAKLRFFTCGLACKIPLTRRFAAHVLTGTKTGLFSTLNPGALSKDYDLFKASSNTLIE